MAGRIDEALARLKKARQRSPSVVVSYSGGKDSLVVTDMCIRSFDKVEAFIMEFVPGMEIVDEQCLMLQKLWGIECLRYPHWSALNARKWGVHCNLLPDSLDIKDFTLADILHAVRSDTGIQMIANGYKISDGRHRKKIMRVASADTVSPLAGFQKVDVLAYMASRKIPVPKSSGGIMTGIDLSVNSLLWLHDDHPRDFRRICEVFPYAESVVWRRKFYG